MKESKIPPQWFSKFMSHVANNIVNRDGEIRFSYKQMRRTLDVLEHGGENIDEEVRTLLKNTIGALEPIELSDRQITTLCLALLNCHMAYHICDPDLIEFVRAGR